MYADALSALIKILTSACQLHKIENETDRITYFLNIIAYLPIIR